MDLMGTITYFLKLCKVVAQVRIEVDYAPQRTKSHDIPRTSKEQLVEIPVPVPPIRMQVLREVLDMGTLEFNDVSKSIGMTTIDFLQMRMTIALQNDPIT